MPSLLSDLKLAHHWRQVDSSRSLAMADLFKAVVDEPGDWEEACLGPVVKYLRVSKLVKVPPEWKALIPK